MSNCSASPPLFFKIISKDPPNAGLTEAVSNKILWVDEAPGPEILKCPWTGEKQEEEMKLSKAEPVFWGF